mgnify:CR=1 FL=1
MVVRRRVALYMGGQRDCAQEVSGVVRRRVALYMGGQRDCAQEVSGVVRRRVAWLWQDAIAS